jgi:hypothetical protein
MEQYKWRIVAKLASGSELLVKQGQRIYLLKEIALLDVLHEENYDCPDCTHIEKQVYEHITNTLIYTITTKSTNKSRSWKARLMSKLTAKWKTT